jgi:hypothetical protein
MMESSETLLPNFTARKKGTFVSLTLTTFTYRIESTQVICAEPGQLDLSENVKIEEHQAYKISKLLAQKTFFSHAFSRVRTRAVSRAHVIHNVGLFDPHVCELVNSLSYKSNSEVFTLD